MSEITDMAVFVKVVEQNNMTLAGRELRMTPGAVTKRISKLETRLGVRLLNRTTRKISTTEAGEEFYETSKQILKDIDWLESSVSAYSDTPRGMLKITCPSLFGRVQVSPLLLAFKREFPSVHVHLQLTDRIVNLIGEGVDVAIRNTDHADSSLIVRHLADDRKVVCGAPEYFETFGTPQCPEDLLQHNCLLLRFPGSKSYRWHFLNESKEQSFLVKGTIDTNSTEVLREWTLAGIGLSMFSTAEVANELRTGRLKAVLTDYMEPPNSYNLLFPKRDLMPQKTRVFVDFISTRIGRTPKWDEGLGF